MIDSRELKSLGEIVEKTHQTLRIYSELYSERKKLYKKAFKPRDSGERIDAVERLKTINAREMRVFSIVKEPAEKLCFHLKEVQNLKDYQATLYLIYRYFEQVMNAQHDFLVQEQRFLNNQVSIAEFKTYFSKYFSELDSFSRMITGQLSKFYSPGDFKDLVIKNKKALGVAYLDLLGAVTVFVALFAGFEVFDHSIPKQLFDASKFPDLKVFVEYVFIAYTLTVLNLPHKAYTMIKKSISKVVSMASDAVSRDAIGVGFLMKP